MTVTTVRYHVSGRVQGVGYRWFVLRTAQRLGIGGWVRNLPDGRVEALAQGRPDQLSALEAALKSGPRFSRVDHVEKTDDPHDTNTYKSFDVR